MSGEDRAALAQKARLVTALVEDDEDVNVAAIAAAPAWFDLIARDETLFLKLVGVLVGQAQWRGRLEGEVIRALAASLGESLCDRVLAATASAPQPGAAPSPAPALNPDTATAIGRGALLAALHDQPAALGGLLRRRWRDQTVDAIAIQPAQARWIAAWAATLLQDFNTRSENKPDELHAPLDGRESAAQDGLAGS